MNASRLCAALALAAATALPAAAETPFATEIEARQGQFKLLAINVGPLVGMAQGQVPYDAALARQAADNLVAIAGLHEGLLWPEGSDNAAVAGTRALPAIWEDIEDFGTRLAALRSATADLQGVAGDGLEAVQGAIGPVGAACSSCHQAYRAPQ